MKRLIYILFVPMILFSCKNDMTVKMGLELDSVTYTITGNDAQNDSNNYSNSNVTEMFKKTYNISAVSPLAPKRKGYNFSIWVNTENDSYTYKQGSAFSEDDQDWYPQLTLKAEFVPNYSRYFTPHTMFTLSGNMLQSTGLKQHANNAVSRFDPVDPLDVNFVSFPGGYNIPVQKTNDSTGAINNSYIAVVGLNKGGDTDTALWVVEDFALSQSEVSAGLFKLVEDWNSKNNKGYDFGFNRMQSPDGYDDYPYYGAFYDGNNIKNRDSAYDPVCYLPWDSAVVFSNALTEWYNETFKENLSFAYTISGKSYDSPIKSVKDHAGYIQRIDSDDVVDDNIKDKPIMTPVDGSTSVSFKTIPHVKGATGFRLPTSAEWLFAAMIEPDSLNNSSQHQTLSGYIYPTLIISNVISGSKSTGDEYLYAITNNIYGSGASYDSGTEKVGSKSVKQTQNDSGKRFAFRTNASSLYDMSGNVKEYTETLVKIGNSAYRGAYGGGFDNTNSECVPAFMYTNGGNDNMMIEQFDKYYDTGNFFNLSSVSYGIRLARTISTVPYKVQKYT